MSTLKEFSRKFVSTDTVEGEKARWRKVFPSELRFEEKFVQTNWFRADTTRMELQEKWERIHKGDVIDTEWRSVPVEHLPYEWY